MFICFTSQLSWWKCKPLQHTLQAKWNLLGDMDIVEDQAVKMTGNSHASQPSDKASRCELLLRCATKWWLKGSTCQVHQLRAVQVWKRAALDFLFNSSNTRRNPLGKRKLIIFQHGKHEANWCASNLSSLPFWRFPHFRINLTSLAPFLIHETQAAVETGHLHPVFILQGCRGHCSYDLDKNQNLKVPGLSRNIYIYLSHLDYHGNEIPSHVITSILFWNRKGN